MKDHQPITFKVATTPEDLLHHFRLRKLIFIDEQGVEESLEMDGLDHQATLILGALGPVPVAVARYRLLGDSVKVERVGVLKGFRHQGIGQAVMAFVEDQIATYTKASLITLHAQDHAIPFYHHLG